MPPPQPSPARGGGSKEVALPCSALFALRSVLLPRVRGRENDPVRKTQGAHANQPCSIQPPCSPVGAKAQARWPCEVSMM